MIVGIGTDMIEVSRIDKACQKKRFFQKIYTDKERDILLTPKLNAERAAGNFAVKESVVKMFGTGFRSILPSQIEVLRDEQGKPFVVLYDQAKKQANDLGIKNIHVSITNTNEYALAFVVGETDS